MLLLDRIQKSVLTPSCCWLSATLALALLFRRNFTKLFRALRFSRERALFGRGLRYDIGIGTSAKNLTLLRRKFPQNSFFQNLLAFHDRCELWFLFGEPIRVVTQHHLPEGGPRMEAVFLTIAILAAAVLIDSIFTIARLGRVERETASEDTAGNEASGVHLTAPDYSA
jgi:hypothetical protein